jgi:hypothetical protein
LIAAVALKVEGEPVTLDERHFKRVKGLKVYIYQDLRETLLINCRSNIIVVCIITAEATS